MRSRRAERVDPALLARSGSGTVRRDWASMLSMASRSKLCGHFVEVTGSRKVRSVRGHLREMISRSMAMEEEREEDGELLGWAAWCWGRDWRGGWVGEDVVDEGEGDCEKGGSSRWENQVEACGRGGMSLPWCWESCTMR